MTRQRKWQLKQKELGNCIICGKPAKRTRCDEHHAAFKESNKRWKRRKSFPVDLWSKALDFFAHGEKA